MANTPFAIESSRTINILIPNYDAEAAVRRQRQNQQQRDRRLRRQRRKNDSPPAPAAEGSATPTDVGAASGATGCAGQRDPASGSRSSQGELRF